MNKRNKGEKTAAERQSRYKQKIAGRVDLVLDAESEHALASIVLETGESRSAALRRIIVSSYRSSAV
jgi:hypothetical protein